MRDYNFVVYITTNPSQSALYTGMTNSIMRRLLEHYLNRGKPETFAGRYYCYNLIWFEWHQYVYDALSREKSIKQFTREQKEALINEMNVQRRFLNADICGVWPPTAEMIAAHLEKWR